MPKVKDEGTALWTLHDRMELAWIIPALLEGSRYGLGGNLVIFGECRRV